MKLQEMSGQYSADADAFAARIQQLEAQLRQESDTAAAYHLQRRITELQPMLRQSRAMARLTRHYYDRGYRRNDAYRL